MPASVELLGIGLASTFCLLPLSAAYTTCSVSLFFFCFEVISIPAGSQVLLLHIPLLIEPGARFSKVPIINGPGKLSPFTLKIEVSIVLHLI